MRSTVRIDDDLLDELRSRAARAKVSLTRTLNDVVRLGLEAGRGGVSSPRHRRYREKTFSMGVPRIELTKALSVAAAVEDEELVRKAMLRK